MALLPSVPGNLYVQQGNAQILVTWNLVPGATIYSVQRSTDGVTFATIATPLTNSYLDTAVTPGTAYWYQVASSVGGSLYSNYNYTQANGLPAMEIPAISGQMSLYGIRLAAQQMSDRVNSNFVSMPEWNKFINLAADELYDLITTSYEDYQMYQPVYFQTGNSTSSYNMPDGITVFKDANGNNIVPPPIYKLSGVDLGLNNAPNGFVTVSRYNFIDRNRYVFPNTASTIYGVFGLQYRFIGNQIRFIPQPSSNQPIGLWYIPRRVQLLQDTDLSEGYNGWIRYVIVRAAKYALDKEESDTSKLDIEIAFLKDRIEGAAPNRDEGQADTISDARSAQGFGPDGGNSGGWGGFGGNGW
jgi:hypothetical protein